VDTGTPKDLSEAHTYYGQLRIITFSEEAMFSSLRATLLLAVAVLSTCFPSLQAEVSTIRIGALAELTGPGAMNGAACQTGYRVAESLFREQYPQIAAHVEVIYGDHRREQKTAISEFQRLLHLGVWAVAANHGNIGVAINPLSRQTQTPLFGVMGHADFVQTNPYAVRVIPTPLQEGGGLARNAFASGARRAAILVLEDDYILAVAAAFEKQFKELGGTIVYRDYIPEATTDFSTIGTRIRASHPEIIAMTLGFQQFGPAIRRLREQGVTQPIYANYWLSYPSIIADAGGAGHLEGSVYITEQSDFPVFLERYQKLATQEFRAGVVFRCYTALGSALSLLGEHPELTSKREYSALIGNLSQLKLPDREISIKNREVAFEPEFYTFKDGAWVRK
jgi:ABC-type branched-subunit amino acid transport system substrate-binding protein